MQEREHSIMLTQKKNLTVSGVESVSSFSEAKIVLTLLSGDKVIIVGTGLKITGFEKASGKFTSEGEVVGISYGAKSVLSRIFK